MFNTGPHNSQIHNGGPPGWPFAGFADTLQSIVKYHVPLVMADCLQIVWRDMAEDVNTQQVVFAVIIRETHIVQV